MIEDFPFSKGEILKEITWITWNILPRKLKTNMSPANQWLEDVCPVEIVPF